MSQLRVGLLRGFKLLNTSSAPARLLVPRRFKSIEKAKEKPIKFTTSEAHVNYKSVLNFAGDGSEELPNSHNAVIAFTGILGIFYLIFLRDDCDEDGGLALLKPLHETTPQYAIPMLRAAIAENRKFGYDTSKLEKKLAEYLKDPDRYGGGSPQKMVEN